MRVCAHMIRRRPYKPVLFKVPLGAQVVGRILQEVAQSRAWVEQTKQPFDCPKDDKRLNPALSKGGVQCREHYRQCGEAAGPGDGFATYMHNLSLENIIPGGAKAVVALSENHLGFDKLHE